MPLLQSLTSHKPEEIVDALFKIGGSPDAPGEGSLVAVLEELMAHEDVQVREAVAVQCVLRRRLPKLFPAVLHQLKGAESSPSVLIPLIDGATAIVLHGGGDKRELARTLANYVRRPTEDDEVRGTAYLCLLKLSNRISAKEYARSPAKLSEMSVDQDVVDHAWKTPGGSERASRTRQRDEGSS